MRYNQPQSGPASVDTGFPLGRALRVVVLGSLGVELVRRKTISRASGVSRVTTTAGIAYQHSPSNGNVNFGATGGLSAIVPSGSPLTIFMRVIVSTLGIRQGLLTDHDGGGSNESLTIEITAGNIWRVTTFGGANEILGGAVTAGRHDVMVVHRPGTGNQLYVDGVSVGSSAFAGSLAAGSALRLGSFGAFTTLGFAGRTEALYILEGDHSAQFKSLIANPWQVFESRSNVALLQAPAAGGGVDGTLTATLGSATLSSAGTSSIAGSLNKTLGAATVSSSGAVAIVGALSKPLGSLSVSSTATVQVAGTLAATLAPATLASSGTTGSTGIVGGLSKMLGTLSVAASGGLTVSGSLAKSLDALISAAPVPPPNVFSATIMRESIINSQVTALLDRISSQAGTMVDTLNSTTIMRATETNSVGNMRANDINQTANIL